MVTSVQVVMLYGVFLAIQTTARSERRMNNDSACVNAFFLQKDLRTRNLLLKFYGQKSIAMIFLKLLLFILQSIILLGVLLCVMWFLFSFYCLRCLCPLSFSYYSYSLPYMFCMLRVLYFSEWITRCDRHSLQSNVIEWCDALFVLFFSLLYNFNL